jgi:iron complex transport system ATP-binding protein
MTRDPAFELRDAVVQRNGRPILSVRRLALTEGEHVAVLGPNGAGKSTLIRLLARDVRPVAHDDGSPAVLLRGRDRWDILEARRLFGIVSDDLTETFARPMTARDAVVSGFFGSVGTHRHQRVTGAMLERADDLLAELGATSLAERTMDTLSTGEARRVLIARALVHDPPMLVLDEPCDGLDPSAAFHFLRTLRETAAAGRTLVLVTHHIDDIVPEIGRVIMVKDGRVLRDGAKEDLLRDEVLSELYGIPAHVEERGGWYRLW